MERKSSLSVFSCLVCVSFSVLFLCVCVFYRKSSPSVCVCVLYGKELNVFVLSRKRTERVRKVAFCLAVSLLTREREIEGEGEERRFT
jgi:hypothetical protein